MERKMEGEYRAQIVEKTLNAFDVYDVQIEDLKVNKSWIPVDEFKDLDEKLWEMREWFTEIISQQEKLELYDDPVFKAESIVTKMKALKKLYTKLANKKAPKPKKEEVKVEEEEEDFNDGDDNDQKEDK